jgi:hypothetical protein
MDARCPKHGCVAIREAAMAVGMTKHNRVMIWVGLSNSRRTAYSATIVGRGFARAPMAERPVVLPPENQGADASCHFYSSQHRHRALGAASRLW